MGLLKDYAISFATGDFYLSSEMQVFWMAIQGAVAIRKGPNKDRDLHWFHAFVLSMLAGFSGGWFGFIWMGRPTSMLSSDINTAAVILAYIAINHVPYDYGFSICTTRPGILVTTVFAQLFRSRGIQSFVKVAFETFKDNPSPYYPIPVFGPVLYATLLGNMAGFIMKGLEGHVANGLPWPVQNGLFCATFFHFFVNDEDGPIGWFLRTTIPAKGLLGLENREFAAVVVTYFMVVVGILQLPMFFGPTFSPFGLDLLNPFFDSSTWTVGQEESVYSQKQDRAEEINQDKEVVTPRRSTRTRKPKYA